MNFEILFLLHLKKGFLFPLDYSAKTPKNRKQQIKRETKEKRNPKESEEAFVDCFGTPEKSEVS
jgi:hypothetical protein